MRVTLDIAPGMNLEHSSFALKDAAWLDADGRFRDGLPENLGQVGPIYYNGAVINLTGVARSAYTWTAEIQGTIGVAIGTHSKLYAGYFSSGQVISLTDITPVGLAAGNQNGTQGFAGPIPFKQFDTINYAQPRIWSPANWGNILIACPSGKGIYESTGLATATPVTNAPARCIQVMVAPDRRQVIALGCSQVTGGVPNAKCIRGSDVEDRNAWTPSSSSLSFQFILPDDGGIVGGRFVGQYMFVWTDKNLYIAEFIGDPQQCWRFNRAGEHCGLAGMNAVCVDGLTVTWLTNTGVLKQMRPGSQPTTIDSPVLRDMWTHTATAQADKIVLSTVSRFDELHIFYPDSRDGTENSRRIVVNSQGQWSRQSIVRTGYLDAGATPFPVALSMGTAFYEEASDGVFPSLTLKTAAQYLDKAGSRLKIKHMWPDIQVQAADVTMSLYGREEPQAPETLLRTIVIPPGQSQLDFMVTTRLVRVEFTSTGYFRIGSPVFEVEPSSKW